MITNRVIFFAFLQIIISSCLAATKFTFPTVEYNALYSLYQSTNGEHWKWQQFEPGIPWNFATIPPENPCSFSQPWQGITCSSTCQTSACYVTAIDLPGKRLLGTLPNALQNLTHLTQLNLEENSLSGSVPAALGEIKTLVSVNLYENYFIGSLPESFCNLLSLTYFDINTNMLTGPISSCFGNLSALKSLILYDNGLSGSIPSTLCNLASISYLELSNNKFTGSIPTCIGNMQALTILHLDTNSFNGFIPSSIGLLTNLMGLLLSANHFSGTIPESFGLLKNIKTLDCDTNALSGSIPSSFGNLTSLSLLNLNRNQMSGSIPLAFRSLAHLTYLFLSKNRLTGSISDIFVHLTRLEYLALDQNRLTGTIPSFLGNLTSLIKLYLDVNHFSGQIPDIGGLLPSLAIIWMQYNALTGPIPASLCSLPQLYELELEGNQLTGSIPDTFLNTSGIYAVFLYSNLLTGTIPTSLVKSQSKLGQLELYDNFLTGNLYGLSDLKSIIYLFCRTNLFTGTIPEFLGNFDHLVYLALGENMLSGTIPTTLGTSRALSWLMLSRNELTGTIPESLVFNPFTELWLDNNLLTGTIPYNEVGNNASLLFILVLSGNMLTGTIPSMLSTFKILQLLSLSDNELSGTVPESFGDLSGILLLDLGGNQLTDAIPSSFSNLSRVERLSLNSNYFTGDCNNWITSPDITVLYLYNNLFYGNLNVHFSSTLQAIDVSSNSFSGTISESIFANASSLEMVNVNNNDFSGLIPDTVFNSKKLLSVVLASNCFEGTLPKTICNSAGLQQLILDGLHSSQSCISQAIPGMSNSGISSKQEVHGTIPICLLQLQMLVKLHLGGNSFSGSIPNVPISKSLKELVLSTNQFTGSVPSYVWDNNITSLDLSFNRLQGNLPLTMLPSAQKQTLETVDNTSSVFIKLQVNQFAGTIPSFMRNLGPGSVDILEGNMFACDADRSDIPDNDPKARIYNCGSDSTNYGLIVFGVVAGLVCLILVAVPTPLRVMRELLAVYRSQYAETAVSALLTDIYSAVDRLTGLCLMGMVVFGVLSMYYSSYADVYGWTVSAIYKTGFSPAIVMLLWLCLCVERVVSRVGTYAVEISTTLSTDKPLDYRLVNWLGPNYCNGLILYLALFINIIVVTTVNGIYVSALVVSDYTVQTLIVITLALSVFKIVWNYALVRGSHFIESLTDGVVLGACLFNNLLAPLLAEMFASPDCFLYIVSQAAAVTFNYNVYLCPLEASFGTIKPCSFPDLVAGGNGTPVELSIIPPFHYSYQCSFSLISSYVYVFIFRYVITGLVEPLMRCCIYSCVSYVFACKIGRSVNPISRSLNMIARLLPPFWQSLLYLDITIDQPEKFQQHLLLLKDYVQKGIFRRRWTVLLVTDIAMLICFGALFPPLAVVIAVSVIKDVMNVRLSLGKYCSIMERVQDESVKKQMMDLKAYLDGEILQAGREIRNGIWYGMLMATWIWAFVLFDTLASSVGVREGCWVLVVMVCCPLLLYGCLKLLNAYKERALPNENDGCFENGVVSMMEIKNPISSSNDIENE